MRGVNPQQIETSAENFLVEPICVHRHTTLQNKFRDQTSTSGINQRATRTSKPRIGPRASVSHVCSSEHDSASTVETLVPPAIEAENGRLFGNHSAICYNPEFLREGTAVADFYAPSTQKV